MPTKLQNHQQLNSEKHKFRLRMKPISNSFVGSSKAPSLRALAPLGFFALLLANLSICNAASALSISVPTTIGFDIVSGKAGHSEAATIEILSDDALAGYTLTLSGSETLNASKAENGALNKITSETWTDEKDFGDNTWGLKYCNLADNSDCITSITYTQPTENLQIDKTAVNNSQPVKYALAIGAKTSNDINADTYSNVFTLAATTNPVFRFVGFADWVEGLPDTITGEGLTVNIPNQEPTKTGYKFAGWCPVKPINNGTTCPTEKVQKNTSNYALTTTNGVAYAQLYAIWEYDTSCLDFDISTVYNLQDVSIWGNCLSVGMKITAKDTRDDNTYRVSRLPDGKIWMLDNLKLETTENDLSSDDTNVLNTWEGFPNTSDEFKYKLPASVDNEFRSYIEAMLNSDHKNYYSGQSGISRDQEVDGVSTDSWKYGVYYNACAASAGTYCMAGGLASEDIEWDICPKDWRLPRGNTANNEFHSLYLMSGSHTNFRKLLYLPLSGYFSNNYLQRRGDYGVFLTSTPRTGFDMQYFVIDISDELGGLGHGRDGGFSVRCVAK